MAFKMTQTISLLHFNAILFLLTLLTRWSRNTDNTNNNSRTSNLSMTPWTDRQQTCYFKLPFMGFYSILTQWRLASLAKHFYTDLEIKLVSSSHLRILFWMYSNLLYFINSLAPDIIPTILTRHLVIYLLGSRNTSMNTFWNHLVKINSCNLVLKCYTQGCSGGGAQGGWAPLYIFLQIV